MSQVVPQETLTRLPVEKGLFTMEEFVEMVRVVKRREELLNDSLCSFL
jgi:hypothetical protein